MSVIGRNAGDLDFERLGERLLTVVVAARALRHRRVVYTLRDYIHPGDDAELEYIRDLFTLTVDEIDEKWFGGDLLEWVRAASQRR